MPFIPNDLYSASAGTALFNYFNPFVTKFDSQSFYNFEQDNQPLYDLEERTLELWEKATGYATSSTTGMPLVVSATNGPSNPNVFSTLQEAVDALPNVIRTPTLIEVATSGNLGGLELKNVKIVETGMLEIVNRGHAKIYTGKGHTSDDLPNGPNVTTSSIVKGTNKTADEGLAFNLSSADLSATINLTSVLGLNTGSKNCSAIFAQRRCNRTFLQYANLTEEDHKRNDKLSVGFIGESTTDVDFFLAEKNTGSVNRFNIPTFERLQYGSASAQISDLTIAGTNNFDVSAKRGDGLEGQRGVSLHRNGNTNAFELGNEVGGLTYCNVLSSIDIQNCNGPLYIRGFCVDGVDGADNDYLSSDYKSSVGIKVLNSNAVLENCATMRNTTYGAEFINSNVNIDRGFFAYRNYEVLSPGNTRADRETAGIRAANSNISLNVNLTYASGADFLFNTQAHTYGMLLENSVLTGGQTRPGTVAYTTDDATIAFAYNKVGVKAVNSTINTSGNFDVYNNHTGIVLDNSLLSTDRLTVENHTHDGILADNSIIEYNNSQVRRVYGSDVSGTRMAQSLFYRNGTHLTLKNGSRMKYYNDLSSISLPSKFGALRFADNHGVGNPQDHVDHKISIPAIQVENSKADLLHARVVASSITDNGPSFRGAVDAADGATVNFIGTGSGATIIQGSEDVRKHAIGVFVDKNSKVNFAGPTLICQFANDVVADNNSTIEFTPKRKYNNCPDASAFDLQHVRNHTSVELHSYYKSCLVANNNSQIIMEDLGCPSMINELSDTDYTFANIAHYVSGGSMQFYPNPAHTSYVGIRDNLRLTCGLADGDETNDVFTTKAADNAAINVDVPYNYFLTDPFNAAASANIMHQISLGGMCVQALAGSVVKANSVHFPMGHVNSEASFFDPSATANGCNQLRIWSFADNSKLYASHLAVSANTPSSMTAYHGPRSTFFSGDGGETVSNHVYDDSGSTAYALPIHTHSTSSLSVLDLFGLGTGIKTDYLDEQPVSALNFARNGDYGIFGHLTYKNKGPFRLFFGTNSAARLLSYASATGSFLSEDTRPMQHIAQGYNMSGPAGVTSSIAPIVSGMSDVLVGWTSPESGGTVSLSGYYYPSALMAKDEGTHVYVDESAADIFANARNCACDLINAGRVAPKVSIYHAGTGVAGEGNSEFINDDAVLPGNMEGYGAGLKSINLFDSRRNI